MPLFLFLEWNFSYWVSLAHLPLVRKQQQVWTIWVGFTDILSSTAEVELDLACLTYVCDSSPGSLWLLFTYENIFSIFYYLENLRCSVCLYCSRPFFSFKFYYFIHSCWIFEIDQYLTRLNNLKFSQPQFSTYTFLPGLYFKACFPTIKEYRFIIWWHLKTYSDVQSNSASSVHCVWAEFCNQ